MEKRIDDERLAQLADEAEQIEQICETHGELPARTVARSLARALRTEIERRAQADAGAGH